MHKQNQLLHKPPLQCVAKANIKKYHIGYRCPVQLLCYWHRCVHWNSWIKKQKIQNNNINEIKANQSNVKDQKNSESWQRAAVHSKSPILQTQCHASMQCNIESFSTRTRHSWQMTKTMPAMREAVVHPDTSLWCAHASNSMLPILH